MSQQTREQVQDAKNTQRIVKRLRQVWSWSREKRKARALSLVKAETAISVGRRGKRYVKRIEYHRCADCKAVKLRRLTHVDHVDPVVPVDEKGPRLSEPGKAVGFDRYIGRLFCPSSNLRVLCIPCHAVKTKKEKEERKKKRG